MSTSHSSIKLPSFPLSERNTWMYENYVLKSIDLLAKDSEFNDPEDLVGG